MVASPTTVDDLSIDLLGNIVVRLPAIHFASADCVSRSWNRACARVLCRPKLSSACSFNSDLEVAVESVLNKVLSEPIRPHFTIASVCRDIDFKTAHLLITKKLGSNVPVVTNCSRGVIGKEVISHEFKEWEVTQDSGAAIMLMVGFLPGMEVETIPLLEPAQLVTEISAFSTSISGCKSPAAIIMFSERQAYVTAAMEKMDDVMSPETVIVGDYECKFQHTNGNSRNISAAQEHDCAAVALVFVAHRNKPLGIGETQFHAVLSSGLIPMGHVYKVTHVEEHSFMTWLTARREGTNELLDAITTWNLACDDPGVSAYRRIYIGLEKVGWMTSFAFSEYFGVNGDNISVAGIGIKIGDTFRIYRPDSTTALSSVANASNHLRSFKQGRSSDDNKWEVFGGLIFNSCDRGEFFYGQSNIDSSPFLDNFPGLTLGGTFCVGEVGRGYLTPYVKESQEQKLRHSCLHACSAVYLIMSYHP